MVRGRNAWLRLSCDPLLTKEGQGEVENMIPYIFWRTIELGPITLQVWGIFVALGFAFGAAMAGWLAKRRGDDPKVVFDLVGWLVITGIVGGRLGHVLFYEPAYYWQHPFEILAIWNGGLSMFGGLIASMAIGYWYLRRRHVDVWRYADVVAFGLPFGKWIGRVGCFLIHDHPGTATDFILGVQYPDGTVRHDLGLYLSINGLVLGLFMLWLSRKSRSVGTYVVVFSIWYGLVRFGLDFLRLVDVRYFGLTPGQYFSVALFAFGIGVWIKKGRK